MIELRATLHVALFYDVLSHVDLGRDAASLYRKPSLVARVRAAPRWVAPLLAAYKAAPGRLVAHALPLLTEDLDALYAWLEAPRGALADEPGRALCQALAAALRQRAPTVSFSTDSPAFDAEVLDTLEVLLAALWVGRDRPRLVVHDAPALAYGDFTHGRAVSLADRQVVAVSLAVDPVLAAIQVLHEATHAITDPQVQTNTVRDTAAGSSGFAEHIRLEQAVVEHDQLLIDELAPAWGEPYHRWRARYGV